MTFLPATQNKRRALIRNSMMVLGVLLLGLAVAARAWDVSVHMPMLAVLAVFCVLAVLEFVTFDEAAKFAHYTAWYWGSLLGVVVIALVQVLAAFSGEPFALIRETIAASLGDASPTEGFLSGMMVALILMAGGFFVVRGVDWLRSR